jgi:hypothetical protein
VGTINVVSIKAVVRIEVCVSMYMRLRVLTADTIRSLQIEAKIFYRTGRVSNCEAFELTVFKKAKVLVAIFVLVHNRHMAAVLAVYVQRLFFACILRVLRMAV